ncbi:MAG: dihydrodipicolinate synthase family protein [Saprospiraceae bacterium]
MKAFKQIRGVIPPMVTPFDQSGAVDFEALERNILRWNTQGPAGYLVLGSNSEAASLSEKEKLSLIARTAATASPGKVILAGTGMESTAETIRFTRAAQGEGASAALVLTPFYYRDAYKDEQLIRHFQEVADAVEIPVLLYNVPKYTQINLSSHAVETLSRHPNIVGMKDSSGNVAQLVEFQRVADPSFQVLVGTAGIWYPALVLGVTGGIMALANCAPEALIEIQALYESGNAAAAERLYRRWAPVNHAVTATYGVPGLKHACALRGYSGGFARGPLQETPAAGKAAIAALIAAAEA